MMPTVVPCRVWIPVPLWPVQQRLEYWAMRSVGIATTTTATIITAIMAVLTVATMIAPIAVTTANPGDFPTTKSKS